MWFLARREAGQPRLINCDTLSRLTTSEIYITQTFGNPRVLMDNKSFPESGTNRTKPLITLRRVIFFSSLLHSAARDKKRSDRNKSKQLCTCALAALFPVRNWSDDSKEGWSWMTLFRGGIGGFWGWLDLILLVRGWKSVVLKWLLDNKVWAI